MALALLRTLSLSIVVAIAAAIASAETADFGDRLYKAEIIVTGTGEAERARGFREGLREVFVKLTGDTMLAEDRRLDAILNDAGNYIQSFTYEDRMKNLPIRDEQGTRDRPHFLRITADPDKIKAALNGLGLQIWRERPPIDVLLTVTDFKRKFLLAEETSPVSPSETLLGLPLAIAHFDGYEQREVLKSIAIRRGLVLRLPDAALCPRSEESNPLLCLFPKQVASQPAARFRGDLMVLPSGYWQLSARSWGYTRGAAYSDASSCFTFEIAEVSFDTALRSSLDAFSAWLRQDKNAPLCGLQGKL